MAPNSTDGVLIEVPSGSATTIGAVQVYWSESQSTSGAHTYAQVLSGGMVLGEAFDPVDHTYTPDDYTLPPGARNFVLETYCSSDDGVDGCDLGSGSETPDLKMFGAQLTLSNSSPPSGEVTGGTLDGNGTVSGTATLSYVAQDAVSGVRIVRLKVDGQIVADSDFTSSCPYENFLACPASESSTIDWNTATVADGNHYLELIAEDAAQNTAVIYQGTLTTKNSQTSSLGALPGPGSSSSSSTADSQASSVAPNGTSASETAQLQLGLRPTITRSFSRRAVTLNGRLLNAQGQPIGGATLEVLQQTAGSTTPRLVTKTQTSSDGTFTVGVPAGPSRLLEVAYRAFFSDSGYTAIARVKETVEAGVRLRVSPTHTGSEGPILLYGTVEGPIPQQGTIVDLLVYYRGHWEPFRTPQTNRHGYFHEEYQFEGGVGRFPFRAEVPGGQAGFPFASGKSQVVYVSTG